MLYKFDNHSLNLRKFASDLLQNMAKVHNQLLLPSFYSKHGKSSYPLVILSCIQSFISTTIQTLLFCASHTRTSYLCQMHFSNCMANDVQISTFMSNSILYTAKLSTIYENLNPQLMTTKNHSKCC
jgi:hypothetical protein